MAVKMNLGDPDFVNDSEVVSDMISPKFAAELKKTIYDNMTLRLNITVEGKDRHVVKTSCIAVQLTLSECYR